jgi:hypothetical protein
VVSELPGVASVEVPDGAADGKGSVADGDDVARESVGRVLVDAPSPALLASVLVTSVPVEAGTSDAEGEGPSDADAKSEQTPNITDT